MGQEATCTWGNEYQTMDHILCQCAKTSAQREVLKEQIGTSQASKKNLIAKQNKELCVLIESKEIENLKL